MAVKASKQPQVIETFTAADGVIVTLLYSPMTKRFGWQDSQGGCAGFFLSEAEARRQISDQLSLA